MPPIHAALRHSCSFAAGARCRTLSPKAIPARSQCITCIPMKTSPSPSSATAAMTKRRSTSSTGSCATGVQQETKMDPHLIDLVWEVQRETGIEGADRSSAAIVRRKPTPCSAAALRRRPLQPAYARPRHGLLHPGRAARSASRHRLAHAARRRRLLSDLRLAVRAYGHRRRPHVAAHDAGPTGPRIPQSAHRLHSFRRPPARGLRARAGRYQEARRWLRYRHVHRRRRQPGGRLRYRLQTDPYGARQRRRRRAEGAPSAAGARGGRAARARAPKRPSPRRSIASETSSPPRRRRSRRRLPSAEAKLAAEKAKLAKAAANAEAKLAAEKTKLVKIASKARVIAHAEAAPAGSAPNQVILARGFWQGVPDGMAAGRPANRPLAQLPRWRVRAVSQSPMPIPPDRSRNSQPRKTIAFRRKWRSLTRHKPEAMRRRAPFPFAVPRVPKRCAAPLRTAAVQTGDNATTVAVKRVNGRTASVVFTVSTKKMSPVLADMTRLRDPWLRAIVVSPSVNRFLCISRSACATSARWRS